MSDKQMYVPIRCYAADRNPGDSEYGTESAIELLDEWFNTTTTDRFLCVNPEVGHQVWKKYIFFE